jgi:hypothetical protein
MKRGIFFIVWLFTLLTTKSQTTYTFLTCGATGASGPTQTQVNNTYGVGNNLNGSVTVNTGVQSWTVPSTGPYKLELWGAAGGTSAFGSSGSGIKISCQTTLTAGTVLNIVVGQPGQSNGSGTQFSAGGSGGGGSFIYIGAIGSGTLLAAAGGGGGGLSSSTNINTGNSANANFGTSGGTIQGFNNAYVALGGTGGNGGGHTNRGLLGGGPGTGWLSNGNTQYATVTTLIGTRFVGGQATANGKPGGFGGGGASGDNSNNPYVWAGGGGGYSGGAGGHNVGNSDGQVGGGGGSFLTGMNQTNIGFNSGDGVVFITRLYSVNVSQSSSIACNGQSVAALSATVNGGLAPYSYTWLPSGGNTTTATGLGSGVYTILATDANNYITSNTFTITQPSAITTAISQTNAVCFGQTSGNAAVTAAGGTGAYTYSWTGSSSTSSVASNIAAGNYSVTVKDANNCVTGTVVTITQPSSFAVTAGTSTTAVCAGNQITLSGTGASSYTWTGGVTNGSAFAPSATSGYTVTGFVGVCTNTAEVTVTVNPRPTITAANGTICTGQTFTITPSGASTYTYQTGSANVAPTSNTSYTLTGSSAVGCQAINPATVNITVNPLPVVSITGTNAVCSGNSIVLTANGASTYTWSNPSATTTTVSVAPTSNSTYSVTGTSALGCVGSTTTMAVSVYSLPLVSITGTNGVCNGSSIVLTANGASSYTWTNPSSNASTISVAPTANTTYSLAGISSQGCNGTLAALAVTVYSVPVISITGTNGVCNGSTINLTGNGGSTYTWTSPSSNNATVGVSPSTNTTYTLTGRSAQGCLGNTATYAVTVYSLPVIAITGTNAVCNGSSINLTGGGASTYTWAGVTSNNSTVVVSPSTNTTYSLTGTSSQGCTGNTATQAVAVYSLPVIAITGTNAICTGGSALLTANGANTYTWLAPSGNTSTVSVAPTANTTYSLVGTSTQGCTGNTANVTVTVYALPVISVSGNTFICIGQSTSLTATGASTYAWSSGATTSSVVLTPTATGSYTVIGTSINGCISNKVTSITVNSLPALVINGNFTICAGTSSSLTVSGANTYTWNSGANTSSNVLTPTVNSGYVTYSVAGTNTAGCFNSKLDSVLVNALPSLTISGGNMVCNGNTITITASGASTYTWDNGANTSSVALSPSVNTSYTVVGISAQNCSNAAVQSISVVAFPTIAVTGNTVMCAGDSLIFNVSGADTYTWSNSGTGSLVVIHPSASGSLSVIGGVIPGCNDTAMVNITVNPNPTVVPTSAASVICVGESIQLNATGAINYTWSNGATASSVVVNPTITTTYTVNATDANGCKADSTLLLTVSDCAGISSNSANAAVLVYPNPSNGVFTIDANAVGKVEVNVYAVTGQLIRTLSITEKSSIDLSAYDNGIYMVRITASNGETSIKHLIKQ